MKINTFIKTKSGGNFTDVFPHSSITGMDEDGPQSPGDEVIRLIDESKMSPQKLLASRFIEFLGNRRLNMEKFKQLSWNEQNRMKKEFLDS